MRPLSDFQKQDGFTFMEVLVGIGIMLMLTGFAGLYLAGTRSASGTESGARKLVGVLTTARENAISQEAGVRWGVYIDNRANRGSFTLYQINEALLASGDSTIPGTSTDRLHLEANTSFASPTPATYTNIIFEKGTGVPNASTSIVLEQTTDSANTKSVIIRKTGHIDYQ